jgi:hypothetical protein
MKRERVHRVPKKEREPQVEEEVVVEAADDTVLNDIDDLLDEIDSVLEDQSMLVDFRQRSGE